MDNKTATVLLIEDNAAYRAALAAVIEQSAELRCEAACESCEAALAELEDGLAPDIVLSDIGLPGMSGIEGIPYIRALSPASKIIMLTVFDDHDNVFKAICAGANGYLLKDAPTENIVEAIGEVLRGGAPINPQIASKMLNLFARLAVPPQDYGLTEREKDILKCLVAGSSKKQIAAQLFISFHTVDTHLKNIYTKLQVHTASGAVAKVLKENLI